MADLTPRPGLPLWSDHLRFLRRHRAVVEASVALGMLVGVVMALTQQATWSSTASISLTPVPVYVKTTADELVPPEVTIDTDAQLLGSPEVLGAIARELDVDPSEAADHLAVSASPQTHVLHVTVSGASATSAQAATAAATQAFVALRGETLGALAEEQLQQLRLAVTDRESELVGVTGRRIVLADDELQQEVNDLRTALEELEDARTNPAAVIDPADVPRTVDYPNLEVPVVSGAGLGLIAGLLLGAARDRLGTRAPPRRRAHHDHLFVTSHEDHHHAH
ncbi:hypothetical protein GCM10009623_27660 [Nocardioides aestuarii]|uniref:Polysaccharide chain length determinant N-terminal domain-containing protein n=1 Tax=Nocardioides aestuarii TaxID=252231 RepID=A0ABW4TQY9_9ACTN